MSDISNQLIKDSYDYVLQSDLTTGIVYRIGGNIAVNPIFLSGLTINSGFTFSDGSENDGYVLTSDAFGNATWQPSSGVSGEFLPLSGGTVTGDTIFQSGLTANTISATTYLNVNAVTGGSYSNGTIILSGTGVVNGNTITGLTKYFISASTPTSITINNGDRWYNTNNGIELVYINDGDSSQWVQPSNSPGPPGYSNLMVTSGITTSAETLDLSVNYYGVNYNGIVNLTLPNPSGHDGYNMTIKDEGGYAATYRIRLIPSSGLIDGNNYVDMNLNYIALHIVARNNNWWII